ncbi:MAG TPA: TraR/DksA family transcriptional regulator [Candidatus Nealsonbacteria bacterium]|uniref:Zinc finger DksA/TraR C4-type domain-containing protein n=1 Tax=marine sediment metagenome TaxID=412755 RepID=A0A0F9UZG7_9ZZZZ|nr:TraR/DksA family transcriptional regulator [Candidatus Nealsonbacteria bacterium]HEB46222.1 TraR/DksA family transcriptional regulator [Candidatus Nealsonbacteria bacterium]
MDKKNIQEFKERLEKDKENLEKELSSFAKKDEKTAENWNTRYPHFNGGTGGQRLEEAADEVEEYVTLLPIEASLELKLQTVNSALKKIKKGNYGKCEKCKKIIDLERLKAYPGAKTCQKCRK